jgi:hypothetical protein
MSSPNDRGQGTLGFADKTYLLIEIYLASNLSLRYVSREGIQRRKAHTREDHHESM